jgi:hypothetical protein
MVIATISALLVTQAPITFTYQPKVGTVVKYRTEMTQDTGMMGSTVTNAIITMKVTSATAAYTIVQSSMSNVEVKSSSAQTSKAQLETMKKSMMATVTTIKTDRKGKILSFDAGKSSDPTTNALGKIFSGNQGIGFPTKPVKIGDTWKSTVDMSALSDMFGAATKGTKNSSVGSIITTSKLASVNAGRANVSMTIGGDWAMKSKGGANSKGGPNLNMTAKFSGGGAWVVDLATGLPISQNFTQSIAMNTMGQSFTIKMINKMTRI